MINTTAIASLLGQNQFWPVLCASMANDLAASWAVAERCMIPSEGTRRKEHVLDQPRENEGIQVRAGMTTTKYRQRRQASA